MSYKDHAIFQLLETSGIIQPDCVEKFADGVRDNDNLPVYKCTASGVIFLGQIDQAQESYYEKKDVDFYYKDEVTPASVSELPSDVDVFCPLDNDAWRETTYGERLKNKKWLDFGCATGILLERMRPHCQEVAGIELSDQHRTAGQTRGLDIVRSIDEMGERKFDVVSLFHVLEHLPDPVQILNDIKNYLGEKGTLIVEVPHARDFLLETLKSDDFKKFTLWSEHLVLHTRDSLKTLLEMAGFKNVEVHGVQRYPLSNHLYWLSQNKPGGHEHWKHLDSPELIAAYQRKLAEIDQTDTIVAFATI